MTVFKPEELYLRMAEGASIVTGNSRLARVLDGEYAHWRERRGDRQWTTPDILSWKAWIERLWLETGLAGERGTRHAVPTPRQLISLWRSVIENDGDSGPVLRPGALASLAAETRERVIEWRVDTRHPAWFAAGEANENHAAFRRWTQAFENRCRDEGWIPPEDRLPLLARAFRERGCRLRGPVYLAGFDEFTPMQRELIETLECAGAEIQPLALEPRAGRAVLWQSTDARDELDRMARWVRLQHENDPQARIAVVVKDLASRRGEVERALQSVLTPDATGVTNEETPWNLSLGEPLAAVAPVAAAFDLLELLGDPIDIQQAGRVLASPWIRGGTSERRSRALLEKQLRDEYPRRFRLGDLHFCSRQIRRKDRYGNTLPDEQQEAQPWNSPVLDKIISALVRFRRDSNERSPSAWAQAIDRLLSSAGWPLGDGLEGTGGSRNWQAYQSWQKALRELASLDATASRFTQKQALDGLREICRETVFQPRTPHARIQVLGLYEAIGLQFHHLWVLGLHADNWPEPARSNPFIPAVLQNENGLPHSSPARELEVAQRITRRLLDASPDCVFSYPGQQDGEEALPSPLLIDGGISISTETPPGWEETGWCETIRSRGGLETIPLAAPGPFSGKAARGGTSILKNQALCPFRAFAVNRLGAEGLAAPADGITPMLHGSLVHKVLETFWGEVRSQQALLELDETRLRKILQQQVDSVLKERYDMNSRPAFREVEGNRILRLALDYLELEKKRAPFEATDFEKEVLYEIEGQSIRLVIDRIDRLAGGETAIIDYKTGDVKPAKWFGEPMEEPQLPLYAVSAQDTPAAVIYTVIRNDGCEFKGIVRDDGLFPGLPRTGKNHELLAEAGRSLPETTTRWRRVLHRLMADFLSGEAKIQPLQGEKTCRDAYCELQPLCRIGELDRFRLEGPNPAGEDDR